MIPEGGSKAPAERTEGMAKTVAPPVATAVRAGIYVRISHDPDHNELGVQRQERECRELAQRRGWTVASVYADDDLSAFTGKPRPSFERLLDDVRAGIVTAVIAWHPDRLYRHPRDLEQFITTIEQAGCAVETVQAGELNLATPSGRAVARTLGAWGRYESEHKSARLRAKHRELAEAGKDGGSGRPFGYEADRKTIRPAEAALIREAADRVLQGASLRSICSGWNASGIKSTTGKLWSVKVFRGMLISARISGRREVGTDAQGNRLVIGPIVATATWPAIITPEKSDRLRARLTDPARRLNGHSTKYLLTGGIAVCGNVLCGVCEETHVQFTVDKNRRHRKVTYDHAYVAGKVCGTPMVARPKASWIKGQPSIPSVVCASGVGFRGCGGVRISSVPLEVHVVERLLIAIEGGALVRALRGTGEDRKAVMELATVEQKMADLAEDYASDRITRGEWEAARRTLATRQDALRHRVETSRRSVGLDALPDPLRAAWPALELHRQRAIMSALVEKVEVGRGVPGRNKFDPRRVSIRWKA